MTRKHKVQKFVKENPGSHSGRKDSKIRGLVHSHNEPAAAALGYGHIFQCYVYSGQPHSAYFSGS